MTQAIEILERHRLFLTEVEREADVQDAIKAVAITVKQQAEEIERLRELVKRHEDALENIRMILADKSISDTGCVLAIESAMKEVGR